jgi:hypothetical protein
MGSKLLTGKAQTKKTSSPQSMDLNRYTYTQYGVGIVKGNPKRCLRCGKRIRHGKAWTKDTSPVDTTHDAISVMIHADGCCPNQRK